MDDLEEHIAELFSDYRVPTARHHRELTITPLTSKDMREAKRVSADPRCEICGKEFPVGKYVFRKKVCSNKCNLIKRRGKPEVIKSCRKCGKKFKTRKTNKKFCTSECYKARFKGKKPDWSSH